MTHELKGILEAYQTATTSGLKGVLATVVHLKGSSYRRPGVRMFILEDNTMIGAVSGGCVEKEILRQSQSVFKAGIPKMMTYDGRYRLGCEGVLYILIEPFQPNKELLSILNQCMASRMDFSLVCSYTKEEGESSQLGSFLKLNDKLYPFQPNNKVASDISLFEQKMSSCFQLIIVGAEHDAVQLCTVASMTGWEVTIVASATEEKDISYFPGAKELISAEPEMLTINSIDNQTAVVLMTHSYVKDLKYLLRLKDERPAYLGLLGPADRREKLLNELMEYAPEVEDSFFDAIHGPAGLNIGAETAQEIAISIVSEVLSVIRSRNPIKLKDKIGRIHN
ncbi:XdhC family protein [Euzebyella saccharophila]|uniref:XdhC family protein n=1 Tax=Euzebyella saccharophila TaxID=679664 RepID=A0ABV8JRT5_9FLAO|nr:XdhC/CoxI family protein [Euzebyella saccharophila]